MSTQNAPRISDDLRCELADAARAAEASNRPRALLILATLVFVGAGLTLIVSLRRFESAKREYTLQTEYQSRVADLEMQFQRAESLKSSGQAEIGKPLTDLFSRIENAASTVGLVGTPKIPRTTTTSVQNAVKNEYRYSMQDPSLQHLLAWVEACRKAVPGLEVSSLKITPAAKQWNFEVTFVRWERSS